MSRTSGRIWTPRIEFSITRRAFAASILDAAMLDRHVQEAWDLPFLAGGTELTTVLEDAIINKWFRNDASPLAVPTTVYIALFSTATADDGSGTEISGNAYARQAVTFSAPSSGVTSNSSVVTFPAASPSAWGAVSHGAIMTASSGGTMLVHSPLSPAIGNVGAGDVVSFAATQIQLTLD